MNIFKHTVLIFAVILCILSMTYNQPVWAESTQVCVDVKDAYGNPKRDKDGKVKQICRIMKKHEKLEGTPIPEKK